MVITAVDAVARGGDGEGEGPAEDAAAVDAHVVVDVDRRAAPAEVTADQQQQQQQGASGCRICQLADGELPLESGSGLLVRLGCACRGDIGGAHRRCAEAWFSVRGNRRCEICGENAANITGWDGGDGKEFMQQWHDTAGMDGRGSSKTSRFCRSQTFCNVLVACLIIVFILPWFLHNHII